MADFVQESINPDQSNNPSINQPTIFNNSPQPHNQTDKVDLQQQPRRLYFIESYGCAMNTADSEIVESVLQAAGMTPTSDLSQAQLILVNTCAIRENAEQKIWDRLYVFRSLSQSKRKAIRPLVAVLGCMAERLKHQLLEVDGLVDIVVGPDAYRDLPRLIESADSGEVAVNVQLSLEETYADLAPVRRSTNTVNAFVSIMRGCDNMCSYCIVPFTRGRERSRSSTSIIQEVRSLSEQGFKEIMLLGQNVNSYAEIDTNEKRRLLPTREAKTSGFVNISRRPVAKYDFTALLDDLSLIDPELRIRFISPHPKDFPDELLQLISERQNLCKAIHLPAQSGSSSVLARMRRGYTREAYDQLIARARSIVGPDVAVSTDMITGFCDETDDEHAASVDLMRSVGFDAAFMYAYSQREKTHAHRAMNDNVPEPVKLKRLQEVIDAFHATVKSRSARLVGTIQCILVEGTSRRSAERLSGRTDGNRRAMFDAVPIPVLNLDGKDDMRVPVPGDYVAVEVESARALSLQCRPLGITTLTEFHNVYRSGLRVTDATSHVDGESEQMSMKL